MASFTSSGTGSNDSKKRSRRTILGGRPVACDAQINPLKKRPASRRAGGREVAFSANALHKMGEIKKNNLMNRRVYSGHPEG